jgi:hypothetical protein
MPTDTKAELALGQIAEEYYRIRDGVAVPATARGTGAAIRELAIRASDGCGTETARRRVVQLAALCLRFLVDVPPQAKEGAK